jgi:hypothetical protein
VQLTLNLSRSEAARVGRFFRHNAAAHRQQAHNKDIPPEARVTEALKADSWEGLASQVDTALDVRARVEA